MSTINTGRILLPPDVYILVRYDVITVVLENDYREYFFERIYYGNDREKNMMAILHQLWSGFSEIKDDINSTEIERKDANHVLEIIDTLIKNEPEYKRRAVCNGNIQQFCKRDESPELENWKKPRKDDNWI